MNIYEVRKALMSGKSIYDFSEDELRERTLYIRGYDKRYPDVKRFDGQDLGSNIYYLYRICYQTNLTILIIARLYIICKLAG